MFKLLIVVIIVGIGMLGILLAGNPVTQNIQTSVQEKLSDVLPSPTPRVTLTTPPASKTLANDYHIFQTFNNCGPAAFSMALSYYGINKSQAELGLALRPYQNAAGDNDDKSTTLEEIANKSVEYGFVPYHRPNGSIQLIKQFIAYDIPVVARTWLKPDDDIGHYRVVKGYDGDILIQDDSLQGKNLRYTESQFNDIWKQFNYEYLVLIPQDKVEIAKAILADDADPQTAWQKAVQLSEQQLTSNQNDLYARFNLSVAYSNIGDHKKAVEEFEKVESRLPFRTLWYQIEPIESYYELGNYNRVMQITDQILNNHNRAFSELYVIRAKIYQKRGNTSAAQSEYSKAVLYNRSQFSQEDFSKIVIK